MLKCPNLSFEDSVESCFFFIWSSKLKLKLQIQTFQHQVETSSLQGHGSLNLTIIVEHKMMQVQIILVRDGLILCRFQTYWIYIQMRICCYDSHSCFSQALMFLPRIWTISFFLSFTERFYGLIGLFQKSSGTAAFVAIFIRFPCQTHYFL